MTSDRSIRIVLNTKLYPVGAIVGACHKFLARSFVRLDYSGDNDKKVEVVLSPRENVAANGLEDEFRDEVLNYTMKLRVIKGTSKIRDQIFFIVFMTSCKLVTAMPT